MKAVIFVGLLMGGRLASVVVADNHDNVMPLGDDVVSLGWNGWLGRC